MIQAIENAVAGLKASVQRLGVAAENIVNARSVGRVEPYDGFVPHRVEQTSAPERGPRVTVRPVPVPSVQAYQPTSAVADLGGFVGLPNVRLPEQFIDVQVAQQSYEASLKVIETTDALQRVLIDEST
jgi:flagellar basal body rod protein FlgC